jgi:hypothetical protein
LDVDNDKKIVDLSEKLVDQKASTKAKVQLTKDSYMIVSQNNAFGVCLLQNTLNDVKIEASYSKYRIGDEVDIRLVPNTNEVKSNLLLMCQKQVARVSSQ